MCYAYWYAGCWTAPWHLSAFQSSNPDPKIPYDRRSTRMRNMDSKQWVSQNSIKKDARGKKLSGSSQADNCTVWVMTIAAVALAALKDDACHVDDDAVMWGETWATMDQITIKTPNPKCRLYWCLIEFNRLEIQSVMLVFSTPLVNQRPSNLLTGWPPPPPSLCE